MHTSNINKLDFNVLKHKKLPLPVCYYNSVTLRSVGFVLIKVILIELFSRMDCSFLYVVFRLIVIITNTQNLRERKCVLKKAIFDISHLRTL